MTLDEFRDSLYSKTFKEIYLYDYTRIASKCQCQNCIILSHFAYLGFATNNYTLYSSKNVYIFIFAPKHSKTAYTG